jgi:hypothetical protein
MLRLKKNSGDSNTISLIFCTLLLLVMTMTIIDLSITFSNRNVVLTACQNGARTAAIYGGTGTSSASTAIQNKYGTSMASIQTTDCVKAGAKTAVECSVINEIMKSDVAIDIKILAGNGVECGPGTTSKIGERTYCTVRWRWEGIAGSALSVSKDRNVQTTTTATAEAEVIADDPSWAP